MANEDIAREAHANAQANEASAPEVATPEVAASEATTPEATAPEAPANEPAASADDLEDADIEAQLAYEDFKRAREARKRKRTITIVAIVAVALVAAIVFAVTSLGNSGGEEEGADPLSITTAVYRGDFVTTVNASGATQPRSSTVVTPEVEGIIENLQVAEGDTVKEGDVLFTLKNDELDKQVRTAQNALDTAERAVGTAAGNINDAVAAYQSAWDACNESGDWSTFDEASLNGAVSTAEDAYAEAVSTRDEAAITLQEAQANADKRTVKAPVSGDIVSMSAVEGASTSGGTGAEGATSGPLMQIADLSTMKVTVQVNEADIINISEGQAAKATFTAVPDVELDAKVERIATTSSGGSTEGDYGGGGGGVVTYAVTLVIPKPDPELKPGMTANVTITTQSVKDTLIVPASALVEDGEGGATLTVMDNEETGETHDVTVKVIQKNSAEAAVESKDLKEGDLVVLGGGMGDMSGDEMSDESLELM